MPTYEYECQKCGERFEIFQSIKDPPRKTCPKCRGRVKRLMGTGAGIIFKGSGFYATDYRRPSYSAAAKKESAAATPASSKDAGDSKPAAGAKDSGPKDSSAKSGSKD